MRELFSKLMPPALLDGQVRLLLSNMGGSVLPAVLFISALAWRVHDSVQTQTVVLWWFATLATSILSWQQRVTTLNAVGALTKKKISSGRVV